VLVEERRSFRETEMASEREKMVRGELYDPLDPQLVDERRRARLLCKVLNETSEDEPAERDRILKELIPNAGVDLWLQPPFYCDYGSNIALGDKVFFNFNCVVLDVAPVTIGNYVLFGPAVQLYTATHPLSASERRKGLESGKPIWIEDDVWVGGGAIILPGVRIGQGAVIGAGSVVTRDVPGQVFAAGNPCRVIRALEP
jgi:maltose O-acetyltransferase